MKKIILLRCEYQLPEWLAWFNTCQEDYMLAMPDYALITSCIQHGGCLVAKVQQQLVAHTYRSKDLRDDLKVKSKE